MDFSWHRTIYYFSVNVCNLFFMEQVGHMSEAIHRLIAKDNISNWAKYYGAKNNRHNKQGSARTWK